MNVKDQTTLLVALEMATGLAKPGHFKRRQRREFLLFMNEIVASYPGREIFQMFPNGCQTLNRRE